MKAKRVSKRSYYKRAVSMNTGTLQDMLSPILFDSASICVKPIGRRMECGSDGSESCKFFNHVSEHEGMIYAEMVAIEDGQVQAYLSIDDDQNEYVIASFSADDIPDHQETAEEKKERKKLVKNFVNSIMYVGIADNHIAMIPSQSLKSRQLEQYLEHLLKLTNKMPQEDAFILQDTISEAAQKKIQAQPVKALRIGSEISSEQIHQTVSAEQTIESQSVGFKIKDNDSLSKMFVDMLRGKGLANLPLDESLDHANLKLSLTLTYSRRTSASGQRVIDTIASSLRHSEDTDFEIEFADKSTLKGGELRVSGNLNIKKTGANFDREDMRAQLLGWLKDKAM